LPLSNVGTSHIFKYIHLEQYEDSLNNISFRSWDKTIQKKLSSFKDYFVNYVLEYETRNSSARLSLENFQDPFNYTIRIKKSEEKDEILNIDLVETFSYLLGMKIKRFQSLKSQGRIYRIVAGKTNKGETLVIWRSVKNLDFEKDKTFIEETLLKKYEPEMIFINGSSYIENGIIIEPVFKSLMGA